MAALIFILTFLVVALLVFGIWVFAGADANQEQIRKRMNAVHRAERRGDVAQSLKIVRDEMLSSVPVLHRVLLKWSWSSKLQDFILQAGMRTKPAKVLLLSAVIGATAYLFSGLFHLKYFLALPIALAAAGFPLITIAIKRKRRLRRFEERFPEALDLLGRAVRAGHAFTTGLEMIAKECPDPLGGEFRTAFEEQNFGIPLRDALLNLSERVPLIDVRFFVTALLIQKETGGNLAEILDGLSRVIRDRFRIYREVKVKSAHGRLTAGILIALPICLAVALSAINPQYMAALFDDPKGPYILSTAAGMQLVGSMILWKIIHIEV